VLRSATGFDKTISHGGGKMMKILKYLSLILAGLLAVTLTSCGGSSGSSDGDGSTGKLSLSLSDAPAPEYQAVYVTIAEIQVHRTDGADGQWQTILTPNATYNLLDLINGTTAPLGVADLPTGTYTQMRLILADTPDDTENILGDDHPYANYLITSAAEAIELKVPSGFQTGIKLVHSFEVESGRTVGLVLDFDAGRSVVKAGNSGKWLLKPTIKVIGTVNNATLTGAVTDDSLNFIPIPGATVSAQVYDADTATEAKQVTIVRSTVTDSNGGYLMYLEPGTYTIVVTADGYRTAYRQVTVVNDTDYTEDFTLTSATIGLITIELTLPSEPSEESATIEFRQDSPYGMITVMYVNRSESGSYSFRLPNGTYSLVATYSDQIETFTNVVVGDTIPIDFTASL
jgi:hypothetical protein